MASTTLNPSLSSSTSATDAPVVIASQRTLGILYYCIGSFGLVGNMFVLVVLGSSATLRKSRTNKLIMNQSSIDFLAALFLILTTAIEHDIPGNAAYCALWLTKLPLWSLLVSSTYSLMLITIERYLAVVHAIWHKNTVTDRHVIICMPIVWIIGIANNAAYIIPTSKPGPDGSCSVLTF